MNPKTYHPTLYIDIGATNAFFTLRETYLHAHYSRGEGDMGGAVVNGVYQGSVSYEERSFHHQNLSQDAQDAFDKALDLSERLGVPLDPSVKVENLADRLRDIHRADAAERARRAAEAAEREARWAAERAEEERAKLRMIADGKFPVGQHKGKPFRAAPVAYLTWLAEKAETFDSPLMQALGLAVLIAAGKGELTLLPKATPGAFYGTLDQRSCFEVTVVRSSTFTREKYNAPWLTERVHYVYMIEKQTGAALLSRSCAFSAKEGERLRIKATVKEHRLEINNNCAAQTLIQRVQLLKVLEPTVSEEVPA